MGQPFIFVSIPLMSFFVQIRYKLGAIKRLLKIYFTSLSLLREKIVWFTVV